MMHPRLRRRTSKQPEKQRQRCVEYYMKTHSLRSLAEVLVDLEWKEGYLPAVEDGE